MWQRWVAATKIFEKSSDNGATWTPLGLDASIITQGAFSAARLPANVAYTTLNNYFNFDQTFYGNMACAGNLTVNNSITGLDVVANRDLGVARNIGVSGGVTVSGNINVNSGLVQTFSDRHVEFNSAHVYEQCRRSYKIQAIAVPNNVPIRLFSLAAAYTSALIDVSFAFQAGWNKNFAARVFLSGYGGAESKLSLIAGDSTAFFWAVEDTSPGITSLIVQNATGSTINIRAAATTLCWAEHSGISSGYMFY